MVNIRTYTHYLFLLLNAWEYMDWCYMRFSNIIQEVRIFPHTMIRTVRVKFLERTMVQWREMHSLCFVEQHKRETCLGWLSEIHVNSMRWVFWLSMSANGLWVEREKIVDVFFFLAASYPNLGVVYITNTCGWMENHSYTTSCMDLLC